MITVLLLIHVLIALSLVGVILLQRSEGGALGIGGGGGFMTGRSAGNALTKTTAVLAASFFASSLALSILASQHRGTPSILSPASQTGGPIPGLAPLQVPAAPASPPAPATPAAPPSP
jgi:preprotein translocase subunit SecG